MSKTSTEIVALLKELSADMAEMKVAMAEMKAAMTDLQEDNASSAINGEKMYKTLNAKFDIFKNLEAQSREAIQQTAATPRKLTRPGFFKKLFLEEREKYMNILYTQEEIDIAFQDKDVLAKKKDVDRINKVAGIIFTNHIKADSPEGRASAFASLYE
jgi:regulator of replication initiation timing